MKPADNGIAFRRVFVTPEIASGMLEKKGVNRNISEFRVRGMEADMKNGSWRETHQVIAFGRNGELKDGQHRLSAIVNTGIPQWIWVAEGLPDSAMDGIDLQKGRTIADVLTIQGHRLNLVHVAVGRRMMQGMQTTNTFTRRQIMDGIIRHWEAIQFVCDSNVGSIRHASILAAIGRAWYTQDRERLLHFLACMKSGVVRDDQDAAVIPLIRFYQTANRRAGGTQAVEMYCKACSALRAFLKKETITKLVVVEREVFPIPEE